MSGCRLAVDIGGTFTDVVLQKSDGFVSGKVLTTADAPEQGVIQGIEQVLEKSAVSAADIDLAIHGTTLYDSVTHVPWILSHPALPRGRTLEELTSTLHITPTVMDLLGWPIEGELPGGTWTLGVEDWQSSGSAVLDLWRIRMTSCPAP